LREVRCKKGEIGRLKRNKRERERERNRLRKEERKKEGGRER
jgi:hypothetical protein